MLAQAIGDVLLRSSMRQVERFYSVGQFTGAEILLRACSFPSLWIGTALLVVFFVLFSAALSWADLSFVLPATSFGYILNVAFARLFLGEEVTAAKWGGTLLIALGVMVVSRSGVKTEKKEEGVAVSP